MMRFRKIFHFGIGSGIGATLDYIGTLSLFRLTDMRERSALAVVKTLSASLVYFDQLRFTLAAHGHSIFLRVLAEILPVSIGILIVRVGILEGGLGGNIPVAVAVAAALIIASVINFTKQFYFVFQRCGIPWTLVFMERSNDL